MKSRRSAPAVECPASSTEAHLPKDEENHPMPKRSLIGITLLAACAMNASASVCPPTNVVQDPPLFQ